MRYSSKKSTRNKRLAPQSWLSDYSDNVPILCFGLDRVGFFITFLLRVAKVLKQCKNKYSNVDKQRNNLVQSHS